MKRRDFLHKAMHAAAGSALMGGLGHMSLDRRMLAQYQAFNPDNDHVLIMIFLNGGNDALNTVVPIHQMSELNALRPHVVLPENKIIKLPGTNLGFHPALTGFSQLFQEGKLKVIRGVGYDNQNLSHFRSTDIWMSGSDADEVLGSGWLGRYLNIEYADYPQDYPNAVMPDPLSLELGYSNSLLFQGPVANMSVVINGERDFYELVEDEISNVPNNNYGDKLGHVKLIRRQSQVYGESIRNAAQKVNQQFSGYPETSLAQQLKICARLIAGGLRTPIYKVEIGGFDTHASQVDPNDHTQGTHTNLLNQLDEAIMAFMTDLEFLGIADRVTGMTFSEFGRRIVSNASNGTDHGSAGPLFVFGNKVAGGILGSDYVLDPAMTYEDNLDHEFDFRQIYGSMLEQWLCVGNTRRQQSLLNNYQTVPIMQSGTCVTTAVNNGHGHKSRNITISPNPVYDYCRILVKSTTPNKRIDVVDISGRIIQSYVMPNGISTLELNMSEYPGGTYFVRSTTRNAVESATLIKI